MLDPSVTWSFKSLPQQSQSTSNLNGVSSREHSQSNSRANSSTHRHRNPNPTQVFMDCASRLNSTTQSHFHSNQFSNNLDGRFYENTSMEAHSVKRKKDKLEKNSLRKKEANTMRKREEARVKILEAKLAQKEKIKFGVTKLQSNYHRRNATKRVKQIKANFASMTRLALFFQSAYRGREGRSNFNQVVEANIKQVQNSAAIRLQAIARRKVNNIYILKHKVSEQSERALWKT